jgi:hypothetical protein
MHRVATPESIEAALAEYLGILSGFDLLLARQCEMDADNLELATGVSIGDDRESLQSLQHRSYRECFLVMGMTNPRFVETLAAFSPTAEAQLAAAALTYS